MNKTVLKNFATWSRRKLIEQVQTKAFLYGIDEKNGLHIEEQFGQLVINGKTYPLSMKSAFTTLQKQLEQKGYKQLLEEAAYTWFNRIIAIRFMEVHEYLPEKVNVLSSSVGRVDPDILFEYDTMDLEINREEVRELINAGNTEAAFRFLFVAQCNALNRILSFMFEEIQDYTELLLPEFLLDAESVIKKLVQSEELTESFEEIEVIGWLYQYYIAEEKNRVFAQKSKYKKEEIPFATQLFTPKWIVEYMVQNSLGRYWTEAHREDEDLIDKWKYFIKYEEEDFHDEIAPYVNKELKVENIKLIDPAMGSGHILVYAFEVFHEIYEKSGYPEREIPRLILENNLYGLDIDDRAYQLASFAVVMKAASYSKRFLRDVERKTIQLNLASIQETNHIPDDVITYIAQQENGERYNQIVTFFEQYQNAKTYGSLINITEREITFIEERLEQIANNPVKDLFYGEQHEIAKQILPALINQTRIMRNEYDVTVMNPPYLNIKKMPENLGLLVKKNYKKGKTDLFSSFIEKSNSLTKKQGYIGMMTSFVWMFITSYKNLRKHIIENMTIQSLIQPEYSSFGDATIPVCTLVVKNQKINLPGVYIRLEQFKGMKAQQVRALQAIQNPNCEYRFLKYPSTFDKIKEQPIAYWLNEKMESVFEENRTLDEYAQPRQGLATAKDEKYLRLWHEVDISKIGFEMTSRIQSKESGYRWFPFNKGGKFRKWYGNNSHVINWEKDGLDVRSFDKSVIRNINYYFQEGITWGLVSSASPSFRYSPQGFIPGHKGSVIYFDDHEIDIFYTLGLLNSSVVKEVLSIIAPSVGFEVGDLKRIPFIYDEEQALRISQLVRNCIKFAKHQWDRYEYSWDYRGPLILKYNNDFLEESYNEFISETKKIDSNLLDLENQINNHFKNLYGIKNDDSKAEITKTKEVMGRDDVCKQILSYYMGCVTGRFSLDNKEMVYTGGEWDYIEYLLFKPNNYGLVTITEKPYLSEDIITRLYDFISSTISPNKVEENISWLAHSLGLKDGESVESRLRRYFLEEFFNDHCKTYKNKPIYWLIDSGKQKGLRSYIYMHRYKPDTMATIRFEHLQEVQAKYQQEISDLENRLINLNLSAADKKKLNTEKVSFMKKIDELREFDKRLAAIAAKELKIDLDEGVKLNYEKFYCNGEGVLAKIK